MPGRCMPPRSRLDPEILASQGRLSQYGATGRRDWVFDRLRIVGPLVADRRFAPVHADRMDCRPRRCRRRIVGDVGRRQPIASNPRATAGDRRLQRHILSTGGGRFGRAASTHDLAAAAEWGRRALGDRPIAAIGGRRGGLGQPAHANRRSRRQTFATGSRSRSNPGLVRAWICRAWKTQLRRSPVLRVAATA